MLQRACVRPSNSLPSSAASVEHSKSTRDQGLLQRVCARPSNSLPSFAVLEWNTQEARKTKARSKGHVCAQATRCLPMLCLSGTLKKHARPRLATKGVTTQVTGTPFLSTLNIVRSVLKGHLFFVHPHLKISQHA